MSKNTPLPSHMRALVTDGPGQPLELRTVPTPEAISGTVVIKVIASLADPNLPRILKGEAGFTFPSPFTPGGRSIGRIAAVGIDTTAFVEGQLVMAEPFIRARDDYKLRVLWGANDGFTPREKTFMKDNWSAAAYADYVRAPLENCWALNEERFCGKDEDGGLGLDIYDLLQLPNQLVPYGGLRGIGVQPGERVIIAPATGMFTGAAVAVADAMGANVIAVGRNIQVLKELQATFPRVKIVQLKGNIEKDTAAMKAFGPVDAYIDISPPTAVNSTHLRSAFMALEPYGRVSLMGIPANDSIPVPYAIATFSSLTIRGQFMYEPSDVPAFIKLAESGLLKLGKEGGVQIVGKFGLDEVEKAFATASANPEAGRLCMVVP